MANVSAIIRGSLAYWSGWLKRESDSRVASLLMSQPLDTLFLILQYLPPESAVALSLTCKSAYCAFFPAVGRHLDQLCRQNLLILLEPSVGHDHYFCYGCTQLHRFSSSWTPGDRIKGYLGPRCKSDILQFGDLQIGFHLVRLVMNRHLFGPGHGLSLRRLEAHSLRVIWDWKTSSVARIIHGQLYLRVSHQLELLEDRRRNRRGVRSDWNHHICRHITTHPGRRDPRDLAAIVPTQIPELARFGSMLAADEVDVEECDAVLGSCSFCLTDFTTTVRLRRKDRRHPELEPMDVVIVSYHQLGRCRSPWDWEWQALSAKYSSNPSGVMTRAQRLGAGFEEGAIKRRWDEAGSSFL